MTTITQTITALPTAPARTDDPAVFITRADAMMAAIVTMVTEENTWAGQVNTVSAEMIVNAATATTQVALATTQAGNAAASAASAAATANVTKWVSGTNYTEGANTWSPADYLTYRRKVTGGGTTDPSLDTANWESLAASGGISTTATITTSTTLTSASAGYLQTQMTAIGQAVTLPDATTMAVGSPKFYIDNSLGGYPVGIRNTSGTLLMGIAAGGTAFVSCESISTAAGVWSVTGTNLEPGLITIDNTFSSTYASTVLKPFVALDDNKSIHFLYPSGGNGFYAVAVDNTTGAVGTPVAVTASATSGPCTVFKITSTTAIVFYGYDSAETLDAVVLSLSGATTLAVGTRATQLNDTNCWVENFSGAPKIAQLDSTHYLLSYATATGAGTTSVVAWEVTSGTTVTRGSAVNIIAANNVVNSTTTYALTATTGLVIYAEGASAPYAAKAVVISVSGTTCTVGTPASIAASQQGAGPMSSCLLSSTKALLFNDTGNTQMAIYACTITGTAVAFGAKLNVETLANAGVRGNYTGDSATRYNPHLSPLSASTALLWYLDSSGVSRVVVLSESGGTVTKGAIVYNSISQSSTNTAGYGAILPQGTTEFCSSMLRLASTTGYFTVIKSHKINGTSITSGTCAASNHSAGPSGSSGVRLSSGKYVFGCAAAEISTPALEVFSSNGDFLKKAGEIAIPLLGELPTVPAKVSASRIVLLCNYQGLALNTYGLRLLNVEIAA